MPDNDLEFYNSYFRGLKRCKLGEKFKKHDKHPYYIGRIAVTTVKEPLEFEVFLPLEYPFGEARFFCRTLHGYSHQSQSMTEKLGGAICLNVPFIDHLYTRLSLEVEKLYEWIEDFYINNITQDYEYPAFMKKGKVELLFSETTQDFSPERFKEKRFGTFSYSILNSRVKEDKSRSYTLLAQRLGGKGAPWSSHYSEGDLYSGVWLFIEDEPVVDRRLKMSTWEQLCGLVPESFSDFFLNFCIRNPKYILGPPEFRNNYLLALGYPIPSLDGTQEVHWDLILIPVDHFRRAEVKRRPKFIKDYTGPLSWDTTTNASYERFFGRGSLGKRFAESSILILGAGAIGSSLAEALVRGGLKQLCISDNDVVEPGNVCRSKLNFKNTGSLKAESLKESLIDISPYVNLKSIEAIEPANSKGSNYDSLVADLNQYDLIFDCTADNQVLQMLSYGHVVSPVVSLSVTNEAKHLLCISSCDSPDLIGMKSNLVSWLKTDHYPEFKPGTGCWHFTFEANFSQINSLLSKAIDKTDNFISVSKQPKTFLLQREGDRVQQVTFINYFQPELDLKLKVSSETIERLLACFQTHYPKEFGGVLMGSYSKDQKEAVIVDTIMPLKFKSTLKSFTPDTGEINQRLCDYAAEYGQKFEYLGEWHTHPNGSGQYSSVDFGSMKKIASSEAVAVRNPLLLIISGHGNKRSLTFYVFHQNRLNAFTQV